MLQQAVEDLHIDCTRHKSLKKTVTAAMLQNIQNAAQEQKQELHTVDDVTMLVTEQIGKVMPLDAETSEQFQQLMKMMIEQAGEA